MLPGKDERGGEEPVGGGFTSRDSTFPLALTPWLKVCYAGAMTVYFAYGSNMHRSAMKRRCPGACALGPAVLQGYRFFVGLDGWGSVTASPGHAVHGVLWR